MPSANNTQVAPAPATAGSQPESSSDANSGEINVSLADLANELGVSGLSPADLGSDTDSEATSTESSTLEAGSEAEAEENDATTTHPAPESEPASADEAPAATEGTDTELNDGQSSDEVSSDESTDKPAEQAEEKVPAWAQKRFGELTARAKAAEERAAASERDLHALKAAAAQQPATPAQLLAEGDDFSELNSEEALTTREKQLRAVKSWALENLEGGTLPDGNGGVREVSAQKARKLLADSDRALSEGLPARRTYLAERAQATNVARQAYPWLYDPTQVQAQQELAQIKRKIGGQRVGELPNLDLVLGDAIVGEAVRAGHYRLVKVDPKAPASASGKPAVKGSVSVPTAPKVAPAPRAASAPTIRPSGRTVAPQKKAAQERFEKTGSIDDLAALLE